METQKILRSDHLFEYRSVEKKKLILSLSITLIVMIIEFAGGFFTNSIALVTDAGHMFTHAFAIGTSLLAVILAQNPPCHHRTYGLYRAEILAAFINGLFLLIIVGMILYEVVLRFIQPVEILAVEMLIIAFFGLVVNLASIFILQGNRENDLNIRGLFLHMVADGSSSVGILLAAIIIFFTGWSFLDPFVSLLISLVILHWAWGILKESTIILLEMSPSGLNIEILKRDLKSKFSEINEMNHVHLWSITPDLRVFTAHVKREPPSMNQKDLVIEINKYLLERFQIVESTIQIEYN
jgi:cobalt-zinc-cadmium efflux system protein